MAQNDQQAKTEALRARAAERSRADRRGAGVFPSTQLTDPPMNHPSYCMARKSGLSRRRFLSAGTKTIALGGLMKFLPPSWVGGVYASDAPETAEMKFGIIALTDCSPIV